MPLSLSRRVTAISPSLTLAIDSKAKEMKQKGYDEAGIATKTGLNPQYLRRKYIPQAAKFQLAQLKASVQACIQADEDVKTGKLSDTLSVELIIISLSK